MSNQVELPEGIEASHVLLHQFIPLLNSKSIETRTQPSFVLKKTRREIRQIPANRHALNSQDRLERWEKEGGRMGYDSE